MSDGGRNAQPPSATNGGEFLLSLLQNQQQNYRQQAQTPQQQQQSLTVDPAVAAVGPTIPFAPPPWPFNANGDLPYHLPPWPQSLSPPQAFPPNYLGFPQNPFPPPRSQILRNQIQPDLSLLGDNSRGAGIPETDVRGNSVIDKFVGQPTYQEPKLKFGSFTSEIRNPEGFSNGIPQNSLPTTNFNTSKEGGAALGNRSYNGSDRNLQLEPRSNSNLNLNAFRRGNHDSREQERRGGEFGKQHLTGNYRSSPPPGFPSNTRGKGNWGSGTSKSGLEHNVDKQKAVSLEFGSSGVPSGAEDERVRRLSVEGEKSRELGLSGQLDSRGLPALSNLRSEIDEFGDGNSFQARDKFKEDGSTELDDIGEQLVDSLLLEDESDGKNGARQRRISREKDSRSDGRGQRLLSQRMRMLKRQMQCRSDIHRFNAHFLEIYGSLIPAEEEKAQQKQLLSLLERLVCKEWPSARLYLYGSCASTFGVSKSDIDVCLAIDDTDIDKSEILLRLADILQSDNLQNVQALTRARVPIVKLLDPVTGLSCDICINNVLAVVNTKLLRDYAQIDARLRQLAFIVKHWAKSRGVNETYQGTLSSYAYVIMCIHFLQQRRPAILPCLQEMEPTYAVTVDDIECAFFDQVEKLRDFGSRNRETIAQLVWAFFNYWAYRHDYSSSVISVRTGSIISKQEKDWTRRIGNDRHLICIEDPFEVSHDLGRVVDKYSIKVLREEFERAAEIMQYDPNPSVKLFEPYIHG